MLTLETIDLPAPLLQLPQPPRQLFVRGAWDDCLKRPRVGIVGSRKVSAYGRTMTERQLADSPSRA